MIRFLVMTLALLAALSSGASGQCSLTGVAFTPYGTGCTQLGLVPVLSGQFDPPSCTLTLGLTGTPSCCNTFLVATHFVVGAAPVSLPLPLIDPTCTLLVRPDTILTVPNAAGGNLFTAIVPSNVPPGLAFYIQAFRQFFSTFGLTTEIEASQGLVVVTF